jgi:hypothetical protein
MSRLRRHGTRLLFCAVGLAGLVAGCAFPPPPRGRAQPGGSGTGRAPRGLPNAHPVASAASLLPSSAGDAASVGERFLDPAQDPAAPGCPDDWLYTGGHGCRAGN